MNFGKDISAHIDAALGRTPFVKNARLEWHHDMDRLDGQFVLVIETYRTISLDGGDGWHGLDAHDAANLHKAVQGFLMEHGHIGRVKRIVVH